MILLLFTSCGTPSKDEVKNDISGKEDLRPKENSQMKDYKYITSVRKDNQWYFINERNEVLFDKEFTYATFFSDELVCVAMDGLRWPGEDQVYGAYYTAMDKEGVFYDEIKSDLPFVFKEGRTIVSYGPSKRLINKAGEVLKEAKLAGYGEFRDGKVAVFKEGKIEFWDRDGNVVIGPADFTTQSFSEDFALVLLNGKYGFIDSSGELAIPYKYDGGRGFKEGLASVKKGEEYFFINKEGAELFGPFSSTRDFQEGIAAVANDGNWNFIDLEGKQVFDGNYAEADSFSEGVAIVRTHDGKLGLVSIKGEFTAIDARVALQFKNGIAIAEARGKMGYINKDLSWLIEPQYERIHDFFIKG